MRTPCYRAAMRTGIRRELGYTGIEIVVVLALAAILIAGSVLGFKKSMNQEQIDGWARSMTRDLSAGWQEAVTRRTAVTVTITVTPGASSYVVADGSRTIRVGQLPSDITLATTCPSSICSFNKRGVPTATGTITLTSSSTGRSFVITIQTNTGRVWYQ